MKRASRRASPTPGPRAIGWRVPLLIAAVALTYGNSLSGPFVLDDQAAVVGNVSIRDLSQVARLLSPPADTPVAGRPLVNLSFALNYAAGGLEVRGYHLVNIALHMLCVLLAYALIRRTMELPRVRERFDADARPLAFACALLWGVHPLNSEVVNYLSQRTESMMAACYLLTLCAASWSAGGRHRALWAGVGTAAGIAGVLCKESMATAPLAVAMYDRVFLSTTWREVFRERRALYAGLALSWAVAGVVIGSGPRASVAGFSSGVAPWTYLLNQAEMITHYLRLAVWPDRLVAFYGWPQPLTLGDVLAPAVFVLVLLGATVAGLFRAPMASFAAAWFFLTLAPASSIVPVATEVGAERRMYLPLLGAIVLAVLGVRALWMAVRAGSPERRRATAAAVTFAASAALAAATVVRNGEYSSALGLTQTIVERRPGPVSRHMYAEQLAIAGRHDEAIGQLREAVSQGNSRAGYMLGITLFTQRQIEEAIERLDAFVRTEGVRQVPAWLEPPADEILRARTVMGLAFLQKGDWDRAAAQAEATLAVVPRYPEARAVLAHARFGQERWADAAREYRLYLGARPGDIQALLNFGIALVATNQLGEALPVFRRALEIDPANPQAKRLLALAEEDSRKAGGEARPQARRPEPQPR